MYTIKTLNAISPVGLAKLNNKQFDVAVDTDAPDGILVRSADMLNTAFNDNLLAIARAGAGVNNIPLDRCSEQGIVVFNTPGANANAVAELVIGMLIAGSRNVAVAAQWCQGLVGDPAMAKTVEKGKKQFVGNEIKGKTLGVIGLGAIGSRVANCAIELGMEVYGYDPYISIDAAWNLSSQVHHCVNLNDMLPLCDYITIHVPYLPTTKDTINAQTLALCKDGVKILNYARGELVNTEALLEAMETGKVSGYMTDFPSEAILGKPGIVCTPHLGASTPEAEDNCAVMAAKELSDYLKNGNIIHSVNMPEVNQPRAGGKRICIIHKNEPGHDQPDHRPDHRSRPEHREHGEQKQKEHGLHHAGCYRCCGQDAGRKAGCHPRRDPGAYPVKQNDFYFSNPEKSADFSGLLFHREGPWRQPAFPNQDFLQTGNSFSSHLPVSFHLQTVVCLKKRVRDSFF